MNKTIFVLFINMVLSISASMPSPDKTAKETYIGKKIREKILFKEQAVQRIRGSVSLFLDKKKLTSLEGIEELLPKNEWYKITSINLSYNNFSMVPKELLDILDRAQGFSSLFFSNNQLTQLPNKFLDQSKELGTVMLSNNSLSDLPEGFLAGKPELKTVDLSNNNITKLPYGFLGASRQLGTVNLYNNPIATTLKNNNYNVSMKLPDWLVGPIKGIKPLVETPNVDTAIIPGYKAPNFDPNEGYDTEPDEGDIDSMDDDE